MAKSLYLINPRPQFGGYFSADVFERSGLPPAVEIADLATTTVAALAPADWEISICEEHLQAADLNNQSDFIGITGKVTQAPRMLELSAEFRRRGRTVIIGGPCASLSPEMFRGKCDILVIGELEDIAAEFFADLDRGTWKREYVAGRPALTSSPLPRWDLYPVSRALSGCVQTSRGCPFECEFCDVIQYLGRRQRHKSLAQILNELDVLYALGFRTIFLADDNFTVYRQRAKEILNGLRDWNRGRTGGPVGFSTQVSIDAARDPELLRLCAEANINWVFIGIETPNQESLHETKKRQNLKIDLLEQVQAFLDHGISVTAGMIVGFDHDGPDIFRRQMEFAMASPIPIFTTGALVAPAATPLHARMQKEFRLYEGGPEVAASPWDTNIKPARMSRAELLSGLRGLIRELYAPENFTRRVLRMIESLKPVSPAQTAEAVLREVETEGLTVIRNLTKLGPAERAMMLTILRAMPAHPESRKMVLSALFRYAQVRSICDSMPVSPEILVEAAFG